MVYLNKGTFVPKVILISAIIAPITIACIVSFGINFQIPIFILFLVSLGIYCVSILLTYISSASKRYAIRKTEGKIIINYPNICRDSQELVLNPDAIVKMEYYKLSSIHAWCMLHNYLLPCCVFLTYVWDGKQVCKHVGYPDYVELCNLCHALDIELTIK